MPGESPPESDASLRRLIPLLPGAAFRRCHDPTWRLLAVTPGVERVTGHPPETLCRPDGVCFGALIAEEHRARALAAIDKALASAGSYAVEYPIAHADGARRWVLERGARVEGTENGTTLLEGSFEDVTALHRERAKSERLLRQTFASLNDAVFIVDNPRRTITLASPSVERIFGYTPEELVGQPTSILHANEQEHARFGRESRDGLAREGVYRAAGNMRRKDGTVFPTEHTVSLLDPARGLRGGAVSVVRDLSAQDAMQRQLVTSQRLEAVGRLAGGIAHDFNNLLTVIQLNLDLMSDLLPVNQEIAEHVEELGDAADRAAALTRQLLAFSRKQILDPQVVDLNEIVTTLRRLLDRVIGDDIHLDTTLHDASLHVRIDPAQLEQVLMNLVVNARDALPEGGQIRIRTTRSDDACAVIEVEDDGVGMSPEVLDRIFEPFFTTKTKDKGTGLGLATTYGIVRQSGGRIAVKSAPGAGTRFTISLPLTASAPTRPERLEVLSLADRQRAIILLVEDDRALLRATQKCLRATGFEVISAESAEHGLEAVAERSSPIDLVVTDLQLPGMGGVGLITALRARWPTLPALVVSGYTDSDRLGDATTADDIAFLAKPFTPDQLEGKVRALLARVGP